MKRALRSLVVVLVALAAWPMAAADEPEKVLIRSSQAVRDHQADRRGSRRTGRPRVQVRRCRGCGGAAGLAGGAQGDRRRRRRQPGLRDRGAEADRPRRAPGPTRDRRRCARHSCRRRRGARRLDPVAKRRRAGGLPGQQRHRQRERVALGGIHGTGRHRRGDRLRPAARLPASHARRIGRRLRGFRARRPRLQQRRQQRPRHVRGGNDFRQRHVHVCRHQRAANRGPRRVSGLLRQPASEHADPDARHGSAREHLCAQGPPADGRHANLAADRRHRAGDRAARAVRRRRPGRAKHHGLQHEPGRRDGGRRAGSPRSSDRRPARSRHRAGHRRWQRGAVVADHRQPWQRGKRHHRRRREPAAQ